MKSIRVLILGAAFLSCAGGALAAPTPNQADVIVYGSTSGAVIAAVQVRKMGKSVILISPDKHLGGMTSGGLGCTDLGRGLELGGLSREFYHRVWEHYRRPSAWTQEPRYQNGGLLQDNIPAIDDEKEIMLVFEPKIAERIFDNFIAENKVPVVNGRLDLKGGVIMKGPVITAIRMEDGREFRGRMFIDATYEGDLMAKAGVSYTIGREAASKYGEKINGFRAARAPGNQLPLGIDPYVKQGDPSSGLLPGINPPSTAVDGEADEKIQAYCYRVCLTNVPRNRVEIEKPDNYREEDYELLFRVIESGQQKSPYFKFSPIPNRKTDSNNHGGVSMDYIGMNYAYPEADYATREKIAQAHKNWQLGLIWTLQNHPRVPDEIKHRYVDWGLPRDEFADNGNWSPTLYVREARRLVSDYVATQPLLQKARTARPVAMGAYTLDSHHMQRIIDPDGSLRNEGEFQNGIKPYEIDYGVLIPPRSECQNLLVTFCISASHVAFGSIRMEPVFMAMSQSAATAACLAIDDRIPVQDVPYGQLKERLLADGQVLSL